MLIELILALIIGVIAGTIMDLNHQFNPYQTIQAQTQNPPSQTENDKLLEIKKLELEIEKLRLLKK